MSRSRRLYTIGYGGRLLTEVCALCANHGVNVLVDVRSVPYSSFQTDFDRERLQAHFEDGTVRYLWMGDTLGGRPDDPGLFTDGMLDTEPYLASVSVNTGLDRIEHGLAAGFTIALMCAEKDPRRCHRSKQLGVGLSRRGVQVAHIDVDGTLVTQQELESQSNAGQQSLF